MFVVGIFLLTVSGSQYTKYHIYKDLAISDEFKSILQIGHPFPVGQYNPSNKCMLSCNNEPICIVATVDQCNNCILFCNQTTLIHTRSTSGSNLFSKQELPFCLEGFYVDLAAFVCRAQKLFSIACLSSDECSNSAGLQCLSGSCQCPFNLK